MGVSVATGLSDLSKELGETVTNQTTRRIQHYADAVVDFFNERKWPFALKRNTGLVTEAENILDISTITDMRQPGGVKEVLVGSSDTPFKSIDYEERTNYVGKKVFYQDPVDDTVHFMSDVDAGETTEVLYYHIPERITDTASASTYPVPDRYRKVVATLGASYVQYGRYLESQGNRLYNMYTRQLDKVTVQQAEKPTGNPRKFQHYLQRIGFRRTYP